MVFKKTKQPAYGCEKYTPFGAFDSTFPPEGALPDGPDFGCVRSAVYRLAFTNANNYLLRSNI